jgi:hypothetical protein
MSPEIAGNAKPRTLAGPHKATESPIKLQFGGVWPHRVSGIAYWCAEGGITNTSINSAMITASANTCRSSLLRGFGLCELGWASIVLSLVCPLSWLDLCSPLPA